MAEIITLPTKRERNKNLIIRELTENLKHYNPKVRELWVKLAVDFVEANIQDYSTDLKIEIPGDFSESQTKNAIQMIKAGIDEYALKAKKAHLATIAAAIKNLREISECRILHNG